jgi:hypothetical protein
MYANLLRRSLRWSVEQRLILGLVSLVVCLTPAFVHQQLITGPIVNAVLLVCTIAVDGATAALLGLIPSAIAVTNGTLPFVLLPVVPWIAASNIILVFVFEFFYRYSPWVAMLMAVLLKFGFLCFVSISLTHQIAPMAAPAAVAMLSWPQLVTALAGGLIAMGLLRGKS